MKIVKLIRSYLFWKIAIRIEKTAQSSKELGERGKQQYKTTYYKQMNGEKLQLSRLQLPKSALYLVQKKTVEIMSSNTPETETLRALKTFSFRKFHNLQNIPYTIIMSVRTRNL